MRIRTDQLSARCSEVLQVPLGLHDNCKAKMLEALVEHLGKVSVKNDKFLHRESTMFLLLADAALPQKGKLREKLVKYVDDFPFYNFTYERISEELRDNKKYNSDTPSRKLVELTGYEDSSAVAQRLVEEFESLPWQYTCSLPLPKVISEPLIGRIRDGKIGDSVTLRWASERLANMYPLFLESPEKTNAIHRRGLLSLLSEDEKPTWPDGTLIVQIDASGFVGPYSKTSPILDSEVLLRTILGLGVALGAFRFNRDYKPSLPEAYFYVHIHDGSSARLVRKYELDQTIAAGISDLELEDFGSRLPPEKQADWILAKFGQMSFVCSAGARGTRILRSAQWLFDSNCGRNDLLAFVQATVALEILLGDEARSDEISLSELLRNRCAYLIGKSHKQREAILKDFTEIYKIRSHIVHRGKDRLTATETTLFNQLRWLCRRAIQEEVNLLIEDAKEEKQAEETARNDVEVRS